MAAGVFENEEAAKEWLETDESKEVRNRIKALFIIHHYNDKCCFGFIRKSFVVSEKHKQWVSPAFRSLSLTT